MLHRLLVVMITRAGIATLATLAYFAPVHTPGEDGYYIARSSQPPDLAYIIHGRLWIRSLHGANAWPLSTPWPVSGLSWSPDGRAIAFQARSGIGVAVLHGHTGHTIFVRRLPGCCSAEVAWSPSSRYLAFSVEARIGSPANLWLWDSTSQRSRLLLRGVSPNFPGGSWAHDSSRIAVAIGTAMPTWDTKGNPTAEVLDIRSGQVTRLGKGVPGAWSPDDRFLGFDHLWACGATGCFEQEDIRPSSGGPVTVLDRYIRGGWLTYEVWAPRRFGYAYDRWLLGPRGHVLRRIPGQYNRVDSWSPDGHWVAVQSRTQSLQIVLRLVNPDTGWSRRLFVSAPEGGCDACVNEGYEVTWNHSSTAFVMLTPYVFGGTRDVNPSLHLYTLRPGHLSKGLPMSHPNLTVLGWVDHDRAAIIYSGRTLFRYLPGRQKLVPVVRGLPYSNNYFAPGYGSPVALRPGP